MIYLLHRALRDRRFRALRKELLNIMGQLPTITVSLGPRVSLQEKLKSGTIPCRDEGPSLTAVAHRAGVWGRNFLLDNFFSSYLLQHRAQFPLKQLLSDQHGRQRATQDRQVV